MITQNKNFTIKRGDTFKFILTLLNMPTEVSSVDMVVNKPCGEGNVLKLDLKNGITPVEGSAFKYLVFLSKQEVAKMEKGLYPYAIHVEYGEERGTPFMGELIIEENCNA